MSGRSIHIKVDGRTYSGTFVVDRKILTVTTTYGRKAAEISPRAAHEALAHQLLLDLVRGESPQGLDLVTAILAGLLLGWIVLDRSATPARGKAKWAFTRSSLINRPWP